MSNKNSFQYEAKEYAYRVRIKDPEGEIIIDLITPEMSKALTTVMAYSRAPFYCGARFSFNNKKPSLAIKRSSIGGRINPVIFFQFTFYDRLSMKEFFHGEIETLKNKGRLCLVKDHVIELNENNMHTGFFSAVDDLKKRFETWTFQCETYIKITLFAFSCRFTRHPFWKPNERNSQKMKLHR